MGIDYGSVRIGVALSDELQMLAHPCETVPAASPAKALSRIAQIVAEKNVERIVVGLPRHMNGTLGEAAQAATDFAEKLRAQVTCEVSTWDERLSTVAAQRSLREAGKSSRQTRGCVDQVAAQILLQGFLDRLEANRGGATPEVFV